MPAGIYSGVCAKLAAIHIGLMLAHQIPPHTSRLIILTGNIHQAHSAFDASTHSSQEQSLATIQHSFHILSHTLVQRIEFVQVCPSWSLPHFANIYSAVQCHTLTRPNPKGPFTLYILRIDTTHNVLAQWHEIFSHTKFRGQSFIDLPKSSGSTPLEPTTSQYGSWLHILQSREIGLITRFFHCC